MDCDEIDAGLKVQIAKARQAGQVADSTEPRAISAWYDRASNKVFIEIQNGVVVGIPVQYLSELESATPRQLAEIEITPSGYGLHWESLNIDLGVPPLLLRDLK